MEIHVEDIHEWERLSGDELPRLRQLTASIDGQVIGKGKLAERSICEPDLLRDFPNTPMVYQLYVNEDKRGQGIGKKLMDELEQLARQDGAEELLLCVMPDNDVARRLYETRGYEYIGAETVESAWQLSGGTERVWLLPMIKHLAEAEDA